MRNRIDRTPIAALVLMVVCMGMATIPNGWVHKARTRTTTNEPQFFIECALFPWLSWCHTPADPPKIIQPSVPPGCCSDTCMGPCQ